MFRIRIRFWERDEKYRTAVDINRLYISNCAKLFVVNQICPEINCTEAVTSFIYYSKRSIIRINWGARSSGSVKHKVALKVSELEMLVVSSWEKRDVHKKTFCCRSRRGCRKYPRPFPPANSCLQKQTPSWEPNSPSAVHEICLLFLEPEDLSLCTYEAAPVPILSQ